MKRILAVVVLVWCQLVANSLAYAQGDAVELEGKVSSFEDGAQVAYIEDVSISAVDPGIVRELAVDLGTLVQAGQVIARQESRLFQAELHAAESDVAIAELESQNNVNLEYAQESLKLNKAILQRSVLANKAYEKTVSKTEIQQLELQKEQSRLSAEQALMDQKVAGLTLDLKKPCIKNTLSFFQISFPV